MAKAKGDANVAHLILREPSHENLKGGTREFWYCDDGRGLYVDYNAEVFDLKVPETMAFDYDPNTDEVLSWTELRTWYHDATGGEAVMDLGYEPDESGGRVMPPREETDKRW